MTPSHPSILTDVAQNYPDHLRDESRRTGRADGIAFPASTEDLCALLQNAAEKNLPVTIQGARTGITAGAVPDAGLILSLHRLNRILGVHFDATGAARIRIQPGVTLNALRAFLDGETPDTSTWTEAARAALTRLRSGRWMFTPDPTETSASLGGMVACNASGACSFAYGPTRNHISALVVALPSGDLFDLRRGEHRAKNRHFHLTTRSGKKLEGTVPNYTPPAVKNAAGYFTTPEMDLLDLFIGSEGTLGVIVEIEIILRPKPVVTWGMVCFLPDESRAIDLVEWLRDSGKPESDRPVAIEYFDQGVLNLLREASASNPRLPALKPEWQQAVYLEYAADTEDRAVTLGSSVADWLTAAGCDADDSWAAIDEAGLRQLKEFRHAAPEHVNMRIDERRRQHPELTKLGTDLSVPDSHLRSVMTMYRADLAQAGLEYVIFGHIGNNHVHVNIIPRDMDEYRKGKALYEEWARRVVVWGGSVSAEHGIGKLKTNLLQIMYGTHGIAEMRRLKRVFDPDSRLNMGNLFAREA